MLRPRRFGPGDEELLRALADQTAMGLERAELIARLTARDRVKDLFDALADGVGRQRGAPRAAPAGCDLSRPHVFLHGEPRRARTAARRTGRRSSTRLAARLRGRDQVGFFDAGRDGLRAVVLMPDAAAAERVIEQCDAVAAAERVALGVSAPGRGVAESRQALREAARAAQLARTLRPAAARSATSSSAPTSTSSTCGVDDSPRDRHWTAVEALLDARPRSAAPRCSTRSRSTSPGAARSPTPRARSTSTRTRCASGSRGSSA